MFSYKDVFYSLCKKLVSSTSTISIEDAHRCIPGLFGLMKRYVPEFKTEIDNIDRTFIDTICDYIREDYANISLEAFHGLSQGSKEMRDRIGTIFLEILKSYLEAQTVISPEKLGVLFDDYFSRDISDIFEPFTKWISLYKRKETTYQQIIDFMFFPLDCPKYTENFEKELKGANNNDEMFKKFWNILLEVNIFLFKFFNFVLLFSFSYSYSYLFNFQFILFNFQFRILIHTYLISNSYLFDFIFL